jgi:hypothetical protein
MGKSPLEVIDADLTGIRDTVRARIAERLRLGAAIVSASDGKVIQCRNIGGKWSKKTLVFYGEKGRVPSGKIRETKAKAAREIRLRVRHRGLGSKSLAAG